MGQTAIIAPQIIDSTIIGRSLLTAADQAAVQTIAGVSGTDVSADYTWTGEHEFSESVVLKQTDWDSENGKINQPTLTGNTFFSFNGSNIYRVSGIDIIPMSNNTKALGRSDLRWSQIVSVDGNFSGNLECTGLPTSDPAVEGRFWNDGGSVKISAG